MGMHTMAHTTAMITLGWGCIPVMAWWWPHHHHQHRPKGVTIQGVPAILLNDGAPARNVHI